MARTILWIASAFCVVLFALCATGLTATQGVPNDPGERGKIAGKIVDTDDHPIANAKVYARERGRPQTGAIHYFVTSANGEFLITDLRADDYDIFVVLSTSDSMLPGWSQRVHLPKNNPITTVTIRIRSTDMKS